VAKGVDIAIAVWGGRSGKGRFLLSLCGTA